MSWWLPQGLIPYGLTDVLFECLDPDKINKEKQKPVISFLNSGNYSYSISYISIGTWRQGKVDQWNIYIYKDGRTGPISFYLAWRLDLNINNHKDWQEDMINIQGYLKDLMDIAVAFEFRVCLRLCACHVDNFLLLF